MIDQEAVVFPQEGFLRAHAVAQILGVAIVTVWRWSANGRLPQPVRLSPRVTVWRAQDLRAWMQDQGAV